MPFFIILIAVFLAMNVGANNAAAEMEAAYRTGVRTKKEALTLIAIFVILGAIISGLPVLKTLSEGIVPIRTFKSYFYIVFVIMAVSAAYDFISGIFKVSIPTTYAIVSSIAAAGIYYESMDVEKYTDILIWWFLSPICIFVVAFAIGKLLNSKSAKGRRYLKEEKKGRALLGALLTFSGCYVAFAGGANGVGKAMAPVVAAGFIDTRWGVLIAGIGIAAGALIFGKAALETDEREMGEIGFVRAIIIELICATALLTASISGIPLSVSVTVTASLTGLGCADLGIMPSLKKHHIVRNLLMWLIVPFTSAWLTYLLLHLLTVILK
ncbi:MAG: inorganic phosphate transporter [Candidatus Omnitrophica bacterium]|nr:inorganic phosphate transporter [Candidatus Omnitrophota bacterium]